MIIRISSEGQYRINSSYLDQLNAIDNEIMLALGGGDREKFASLFQDLLAIVRDHGEEIPDDELVESQVILPPPDITFDEALHYFDEEGMIPG